MAWPETVRKEDLRIEFIRGSGKGGQKRNKSSSCVRITHIPTGIAVRVEDERSQTQNKTVAWNRLCEKLIPLMKKEVQKARCISGTERIRTYHEPDQRVTDERIDNKQWRYQDVIHGNAFAEIIEALKYS